MQAIPPLGITRNTLGPKPHRPPSETIVHHRDTINPPARDPAQGIPRNMLGPKPHRPQSETIVHHRKQIKWFRRSPGGRRTAPLQCNPAACSPAQAAQYAWLEAAPPTIGNDFPITANKSSGFAGLLGETHRTAAIQTIPLHTRLIQHHGRRVHLFRS